jgi:hypothetical protein
MDKDRLGRGGTAALMAGMLGGAAGALAYRTPAQRQRWPVQLLTIVATNNSMQPLCADGQTTAVPVTHAVGRRRLRSKGANVAESPTQRSASANAQRGLSYRMGA